MEKWLYLMLGGVAGTFARYALSGVVSQKVGAMFPWGTLVVNVLGCFIIGFLDVLFEKKFLLAPEMRILLMTGFCGAFTTFSTLILESVQMVRNGQMVFAFGNLILSILLGFFVFKAGALLAEWI